ncbi:MAG: hypothetical protein AAFX54_04030 [Pseudomonadota bacterium]
MRAAVHKRRGDLNKAIEVLREGIRLAGGPWMLFSRLGNYLSDAGQYEEALEAYRSGATFDDADENVFRLNRAIVFGRMGNTDDALKEYRNLESAIDPEGVDTRIFWHLKASIARELFDTELDSQLLELCESLAKEIDQQDDFAEEKARFAAAYSCVLARRNQKAASLRWWSKAVALDADAWLAKWQMRQWLLEKHQAGGKVYQLLVEGEWPYDLVDSGAPFGFFRRYDVAADSPEQGFDFLKEFEPEEIRDSLKLIEFEIREEYTDQPKGVYEIYAYRLFNPDIDDDDD